MDVLIATNNRGKAEEIKELFKNTNFNIKFLFDFPELFSGLKITENAKSFEGNALIKAIVVGDMANMITLADDSGLVVEALNGRPGVYSARYSRSGDSRDNYKKVLREMKDISEDKRGCYYNCTVAIYDPETKFVDTVFDVWRGRLAKKPKGSKSFGYAPIFLPQEFNYQKTNAELEAKDLININHRGKAFRKAIDILQKQFKQ